MLRVYLKGRGFVPAKDTFRDTHEHYFTESLRVRVNDSGILSLSVKKFKLKNLSNGVVEGVELQVLRFCEATLLAHYKNDLRQVEKAKALFFLNLISMSETGELYTGFL